MNIYQIQEELLSIFDEIEANEGELTPELEAKLNITQEEFKDKIKGYVGLIKHLEANMKECDDEIKRIKTYKDKKKTFHDKLETIIVKAIDEFGDTKKSGVKYLDYGTGEVAVNKSTSVDTNDFCIKEIGNCIQDIFLFNKGDNQLDVYDRIDKDGSLQLITDRTGYEITNDEVDFIDLNVQLNVRLRDLFTGDGYNVLKEMFKYTDNYKFDANVSKSTIKPTLQQNGSIAPNIAKLIQNENLKIK